MVQKYRVFMITFCIMFLASSLLVARFVAYKIENDVRKMEYLSAAKSNEIIEAIYALLYKAEALSTLVIQGNGEIRDLERMAPIIINSPVIRNILLAPEGQVTRVYPAESNEALVGYDLLGPGDGNKEAELAKQTKRLTLGGPFIGMQGGQILVGRLPVFIRQNGQQKFWGLVSVTLNYPEALRPVRLNELDNLGYACEIWRINPDQNEKQIILQTASAPLSAPVEKEFSLLNATWRISLSPLVPWYASLSFFTMVLGAIVFSVLSGGVAQNYWDMRQLQGILAHMARCDSLTGMPNRRAAFERLHKTLEECQDSGKPFAVVYIDLNDFKAVNDSLGHHVGDCVLKETGQRIVESIPMGQFAGRLGGDEFIVILTDVDPDEVLPEMLQKLRTAMKRPIAERLASGLQVSMSIGTAVYPVHGITIESLTSYADAVMYSCKSRVVRKRRIKPRVLLPTDRMSSV